MIERMAKLQYRFYDRMRHKAAFEVAAKPGAASDLEAMRGHHYGLFVTFKRSGEPVPTPVLFGVDDGKLYFRTDTGVAKIKRIANDPRARVGPCNWRGKPLGPFADGTARILPPSENERTYSILKSNYTFATRAFESLLDRMPIEIVYIEFVPAAAGKREEAA